MEELERISVTAPFITDYDYVEDTLILDDELKQHEINVDLFEFDGMAGYVEFLLKRIVEIERAYNDDYPWGIMEFIHEYVSKNAEKWKRELRGDNLYKVKVVLEFDVESADKLDTVVSNVKELFYDFCDKSVEDYGAIKDARVVNAVGKEVNE